MAPEPTPQDSASAEVLAAEATQEPAPPLDCPAADMPQDGGAAPAQDASPPAQTSEAPPAEVPPEAPAPRPKVAPLKADGPLPLDMLDLLTGMYLDAKHYSTIHKALSQTWSTQHSLGAAIKLMEEYGVKLTAEQQSKLLGLDEASMIEQLVSLLPLQSQEQFEQFFMQLQLIVSTAMRVRQALESGDDSTITKVLDEVGQSNIAKHVSQMAIMQAGLEVQRLKESHTAWVRDASSRMGRMLRGADDAMSAHKQLAEAQAQLSKYASSHNEKAKKMMMGMGSKQDKVVLKIVFQGWLELKAKLKQEEAIRKEYEDRIQEASKRLFDYKTSQKGNAKGVLMRQAAMGDNVLVSEVFAVLIKEVYDAKLELEAEAKLKEIEAKLAAQAGKNKDNAKAVLMRNLAASDSQLCDVCIEAWKKFIEEYKKNKDEEDAIKATEQRMNEFMKSKSEGAKGIIDRMNAATDSGLKEHIMSTWAQQFKDLKESQKMEELLAAKNAQFGAFNERNKGGAMTAGQKATAVKEYGLVNHAMCLWKEFTTIERLLRYYNNRIDARRGQLQGLQTMFRSFATQLETGIKEGTPRDFQVKQRKSNKADNAVALPSANKGTSGTKTPTGSKNDVASAEKTEVVAPLAVETGVPAESGVVEAPPEAPVEVVAS